MPGLGSSLDGLLGFGGRIIERLVARGSPAKDLKKLLVPKGLVFTTCGQHTLFDYRNEVFEPFNATFPRPSRSSSIGNGVQFLNRHLSSVMFQNKESLDPLLDFLRVHTYKGHVSFFFLGISFLQYCDCSEWCLLYP